MLCLLSQSLFLLASLFLKCGDRTKLFIINQWVLELEAHSLKKKKKNNQKLSRASVHPILTAKGQDYD